MLRRRQGRQQGDYLGHQRAYLRCILKRDHWDSLIVGLGGKQDDSTISAEATGSPEKRGGDPLRSKLEWGWGGAETEEGDHLEFSVGTLT